MRKRILSFILCVFTLFALAACQSEDSEPTTDVTTVPTVSTSAPTESTTAPTESVPVANPQISFPMLALSMPMTTETQFAEDGTPIFYSTYQGVSLILEDPEAAHQIVLDLLSRIDSANTSGSAIENGAKSDYAGQTDWTPYFYRTLYAAARLDKAVLSLRGSEAGYEGGIHANETPKSVTYDLLTGKALMLSDILEPEYTLDGLTELVIRGLEESGVPLIPDYVYAVQDLFHSAAPDTWYLSETGLCFSFAPYEVAPYSSGIVTAEIPYSSLVGILRSRYFPPEQPYMTGTLSIRPLAEVTLSDYHRFAELILDSQGQQFLLTTDGMVADLRISVCRRQDGNNAWVEAGSVFAQQILDTDTGILIQAQLSDSQALCVYYTSEDQPHTLYLTMQNGQLLPAE